jgi:hypothetical protein
VSPASQLERISAELAETRRQVHEMAAVLGAERWSARPAPDQWSVAECLIHVNLTSRAFIPLIRDAIVRGHEQKLFATGPYRRDIVGWLLSWITEPPVRFGVSTTPSFVPAAPAPRDEVLGAFDTSQEQLIACVREADGLDLGRLRIVSPFDSRLKYNLYSCLRIIPAHQRQHLAQARRTMETLRGRGGGA